MRVEDFYIKENEKPLDKLVDGYSHTSVFRTVAFIGDSLSSGEFESFEYGEKRHHDLYEYSWGNFSQEMQAVRFIIFPG